MRDWHEARRLDGAIHEQIRINEEVQQRSEPGTSPGETRWAILFILAVIFFKPIAEYFIELYATVAGHLHSLTAMIGL